MKRIFRNARNNQKIDECVSINNGNTIFRASDIIYVEVNKHEVTYHTVSGNYPLRSTLHEAEEKLDSPYFVRANYYYLVNLRFVKSIEKTELILANGEVLAISRSRKKALLERFSKVLGGTI